MMVVEEEGERERHTHAEREKDEAPECMPWVGVL
jgi:hypothetical protein